MRTRAGVTAPAAVAVALVLALAGCSGSSSNASDSASPDTTSSTASAPPTSLPTDGTSPLPTSTSSNAAVAAAAQRYTNLTAAASAAFSQLSSLPTTSTVGDVQAAERRYAAALLVFEKALDSGRWPASARPAIRRVAAAVAVARTDSLRVANSTTQAALVKAAKTQNKNQQSAVSAITGARKALGIPDVTPSP